MREDPRNDTTLAVLIVVLLATVQRVLQELDIDQRATPQVLPSPLEALRALPHPRVPPTRIRSRPWQRRKHHPGDTDS
jgi:hypothetical protein